MIDIVTSQTIGFHFLYPSTYFISREPCNIQTILGSCVSVCIYNPKLKLGGMNHYMMPFWNGAGLASPKYGNIAIEMMLENMKKLGSHLNHCVAKIFGGAHQFDLKNPALMVGNRNIEVAETVLKKYNVPIVAQSVGGDFGRKISFHSATGIVMMKSITNPNK